MTNAELIVTIRNEIERQISDLPDTWSGSPAAKWAFEELLSFLSTLESEKSMEVLKIIRELSENGMREMNDSLDHTDWTEYRKWEGYLQFAKELIKRLENV